MATCNINDLLQEGRCWQCLDNEQWQMVVLQLLCDISQSSGGGGTQRVFHGPSDPNGVQVAPDPSVYYGDDGSFWVKTNGLTDDQGWQPLISASMQEMSRIAAAPKVVLATARLDPELVFSPMLNSSFVKAHEPSAAVKKNADSFLKRFGNWFSSNIWIWSFILVLAVLTGSAKAQFPPPFVRNQMDTNANVIGTNGITIHSTPGLTVISNTGSGASALTNANLVLLSWLTNGGAAIKTVSAGSGISLTNQGTNIVIASTASGGGSGDMLATLVSNEVTIAGASTLTDSAFGTMNVITGTSNYILELPAVAGNTRRIIGIRVDPSFASLVTISNSSLIDGQATRVMWANETAVLECTGSNYVKVAGKSIPMAAKISANNTQNIATATITTILLPALNYDNSGISDTNNSRIVIRRPSIYICTSFTTMKFGSGVTPPMGAPRFLAYLQNNGVIMATTELSISASTGADGHLSLSSTGFFVPGDLINTATYQDNGASRPTWYDVGVGLVCALAVTEQPTW